MTNVLVCVTFIIKKWLLESIIEKKCTFLLAYIDIFIDFLFFKKRGRPKGEELIVVGLPSSKKIKRNNTKKMIVPFIKLKSAEKNMVLLDCVISTSTAKNALKGVVVRKENLKTDFSTISDLIRDEIFVDFYQIGKYFEDSP